MPLPVYYLLDPNGQPLKAVLGQGTTGVTVQDGDTALKLPLTYGSVGPNGLYTRKLEGTTADSYEYLRREKDVYRRLGSHDDIISCLDLSGVGIRLELMEKGNLQEYLQKHIPPDPSRQLTWFRAMARALAHAHDRRILVGDIATRNFLISADFEVKLSDFNQSTILSLDTDMETADDFGYSIYTDIGQLGAVFYTIATGLSCEFDLFKGLPYEPTDAIWPQRSDLPSTENIWIASIIERCWTKSFRNVNELLDVLNATTLP